MKQSSIILSMIIPGEKVPSVDIDMSLQPLIKELVQLWHGVNAHDAYKKMRFTLQGALHYATNDFLAYASLSGWSNKYRFTCPSRGSATKSIWLENEHKFYCMGHPR